jgi:hypothetical protein
MQGNVPKTNFQHPDLGPSLEELEGMMAARLQSGP